MKAFPIIKVLTGVTVLFFTCLSLGAGEKQETFENCVIKVKNSPNTVKACKESLAADSSDGKFTSSDLSRCLESKASDECAGLKTKTEIKDEKSSCEQAFDKYSDLAAKEKEACSAFDKAGGSNCKSKVDSCNKKIGSLSNPFGSTSGEETEGKENGYGALTEIAGVYSQIESMKMQNSGSTTSIASGGGACVKSIDRKARAQEKKDKDRERKDLLDKIKQQKDDILKFKEDLDEERDKNSKEINEIEAENKKEVLAKEKSVSEETSKVSKQLVDIGKQIRARNLAITKKMQELARANFEYQNQMLALSNEKVNMKCKQEFEQLKAGLINSKVSAPPGGSAEEQKQYAALSALAAQYKARGIRGSGEMKALLIATRKACYESADTSRNQAKLANSQTVKNIQDSIEEEKTNMKEDRNAITQAQKDLETLKTQIDKEKQAADAEKGAKLEALSKKLYNQIENSQNKTTVANQKIQELTGEINKLVLVENFEVEDAYSEATEAIEKGRTARARALETCNCSANPTTTICSQLGSDSKAYDGKKVQAPTKSAK